MSITKRAIKIVFYTTFSLASVGVMSVVLAQSREYAGKNPFLIQSISPAPYMKNKALNNRICQNVLK